VERIQETIDFVVRQEAGVQADLPGEEPWVEVAPATCGQGVFALRSFEPEDVIGLVEGEVIDDPDYGSLYGMDMGGNWTLEPGAPFRFLNHRCQPNCGLMVEDTDEGVPPRIWVEALTVIEPGEELVIDYAWPAEFAMACLCGSPQCRGWIVDANQLHEVNAESADEVESPA